MAVVVVVVVAFALVVEDVVALVVAVGFFVVVVGGAVVGVRVVALDVVGRAHGRRGVVVGVVAGVRRHHGEHLALHVVDGRVLPPERVRRGRGRGPGGGGGGASAAFFVAKVDVEDGDVGDVARRGFRRRGVARVVVAARVVVVVVVVGAEGGGAGDGLEELEAAGGFPLREGLVEALDGGVGGAEGGGLVAGLGVVADVGCVGRRSRVGGGRGSAMGPETVRWTQKTVVSKKAARAA